jgi:hypothetical protein
LNSLLPVLNVQPPAQNGLSPILNNALLFYAVKGIHPGTGREDSGDEDEIFSEKKTK